MRGLEVLYCDNHLLVVAKPACQPVVPDESGDPSLLDDGRAWIRREYAKPGEAFLGVVHRLDRPVSGVVVFARTSKAAARLHEQFRTHQVEKLYWGIGCGTPRSNEGVTEQWLRKDRERNVVSVVRPDAPRSVRAVTRWRVLASAHGHTLFELRPVTGRSHQLRVLATSLGCPLVGDLKYGAAEGLPDRSVALHARCLQLEHPTLREPLSWTCAPPSAEVWRLAPA